MLIHALYWLACVGGTLKCSAKWHSRISQLRNWQGVGNCQGCEFFSCQKPLGSGAKPQLPEARGSGGRAPVLGDFSIKISEYIWPIQFSACFGQNSNFKAITHQLKVFKII